MAKNVKLTQDNENVQDFTPGIKGIGKPLEIVEAGSEGAKAVHEYVNHGMGQITAEDKFRGYDDSYQISKGV